MQEEGLRAVARRRCLSLARQAVVQWKETVRKARERQARERRTLKALADVHIGISPSPFKVQWPVDEPQDKVATFLLPQPRHQTPFSARQQGLKFAGHAVMVSLPVNLYWVATPSDLLLLLCVIKPALPR